VTSRKKSKKPSKDYRRNILTILQNLIPISKRIPQSIRDLGAEEVEVEAGLDHLQGRAVVDIGIVVIAAEAKAETEEVEVAVTGVVIVEIEIILEGTDVTDLEAAV
jgi:hypothetical protein